MSAEWNSQTVYPTGAGCRHNSRQWKAQNTNQDQEPGVAMVWRDVNAQAWSETQTYHKGDVCIYDGHEWLAKRTSTGKEPGSYASDWKRFDFNDEE